MSLTRVASGRGQEEDEAMNGSLINTLMAESKATAPVVGLGVTELCWTDRHAGTITRVAESGKRFWFTMDTAKRTDTRGMSESQEYTYTSNPDAPEREARLTKKGWRIVRGSPIALGFRREYHDFSF
jgi:hypothetical protein